MTYSKLCFLILSLIVIETSCKKNTETQTDTYSQSWHLSKNNLSEKPLGLISPPSSGQSLMSSAQTLTTYGCGASLSGNYGGSGYYTYPAYSLNFSTSPQNTRINITVGSYDIPNRFTIYDSLGNTVAYTSWMGYVNYSGPWGSSLNTPETQTLSFTTDVKGSYSLKVETLTQGYSDSWTANVACIVDTSGFVA